MMTAVHRLVLNVLVLGALAFAVPACGGDDDEGGSGGGTTTGAATAANTDFVAQADAICEKANNAETAAGIPPGGAEIEDPDSLKGAVAAVRRAAADLKALEPPAGDEEKVAEMLAAIQTIIKSRGAQYAAMRAKNSDAETDAETEFFEASQDLGVIAGSLGLTQCQGLGF